MLLSPSYSLFGGNEGSIHYLYAVSVLWPLEMLIMYLMRRRNKSKGAAVWVQQDVGAVDLTPWKYSKLVSVIVIVCVLLVYRHSLRSASEHNFGKTALHIRCA